MEVHCRHCCQACIRWSLLWPWSSGFAQPPLWANKACLVSAVLMELFCAMPQLMPSKPWLVSAVPMELCCVLAALLPRGKPSLSPDEDDPLGVHFPDVHAYQELVPHCASRRWLLLFVGLPQTFLLASAGLCLSSVPLKSPEAAGKLPPESSICLVSPWHP